MANGTTVYPSGTVGKRSGRNIYSGMVAVWFEPVPYAGTIR